MKNIQEVLEKKMREAQRVQNEIAALRIVMPLLEEIHHTAELQTVGASQQTTKSFP